MEIRKGNSDILRGVLEEIRDGGWIMDEISEIPRDLSSRDLKDRIYWILTDSFLSRNSIWGMGNRGEILPEIWIRFTEEGAADLEDRIDREISQIMENAVRYRDFYLDSNDRDILQEGIRRDIEFRIQEIRRIGI